MTEISACFGGLEVWPSMVTSPDGKLVNGPIRKRVPNHSKVLNCYPEMIGY